MQRFIKITIFFVVLGLIPGLSVFGGETKKELSEKSLEATPKSGTYTLEGKLLKIEGELWVLEDLLGNQHRLQIGAETKLPQSPKQTGDSVHAVVRNNGLAEIIQ